MNNAIRIAIEKGGYAKEAVKEFGVKAVIGSLTNTRVNKMVTAQTPSFWRALGRALGWKEWEWKLHAINYFQTILDDRDVDAFWKEILT